MTDMMAFPCAPNESGHVLSEGMTLRDWFAGQALIGILANPAREDSENWSWQTGSLTGDAFMYADAMLEARKQ